MMQFYVIAELARVSIKHTMQESAVDHKLCPDCVSDIAGYVSDPDPYQMNGTF